MLYCISYRVRIKNCEKDFLGGAGCPAQTTPLFVRDQPNAVAPAGERAMQENRRFEVASAPDDPLDAVEAERRRMARLLQASVIDPLNLLLAQTSAYEQTLGTHQ